MGLAKVVISGLIGIISTQSFEVPIITRTQKENPITLQGFVQATTKKGSDGRIFPSYEVRGSLTNSSSRDILLIVVKFEAQNFSFKNETTFESNDYFFEGSPPSRQIRSYRLKTQVFLTEC